MYRQLIFWFLGSKPLFRRLLALKLVGKFRIMDFDQFFHSLHLSDQKYSRLLYFCLWPYLKKPLISESFASQNMIRFDFFLADWIFFSQHKLENTNSECFECLVWRIQYISFEMSSKQGPLLMSLPKGCPDDAQRLPWNYSF